MIETFRFKSGDRQLWGCRAVPQSTPKAVVVLCHGLPSGAPSFPGDEGYPMLCRRLAENEYLAFHFSFSGCGQSEGSLDLRLWVSDVIAALNHIESWGCMPPYAVIGFSAGGATALTAAAIDQRIDPLFLAATPFDYGFLNLEAYGLDFFQHYRDIGLVRDTAITEEQFLAAFRVYDAAKLASQIHVTNMAIIHGEDDDLVPTSHAFRIADAFGGKVKVRMLPGVGHKMRIFSQTIDAIIEQLDEWFL